MKAALCLALLAFPMFGCGAASQINRVDSTRADGLINQTQLHSGQQLQAIWTKAQQNLATKPIAINPSEHALHPEIAIRYLPADPRALTTQPKSVTIASVSDVSSAQLQSLTGAQRLDPTGLVPCDTQHGTVYAPACTDTSRYLTQFAASWEADEPNFEFIVEFEMENHILSALGYDLEWR